jgi:hypothetical protein
MLTFLFLGHRHHSCKPFPDSEGRTVIPQARSWGRLKRLESLGSENLRSSISKGILGPSLCSNISINHGYIYASLWPSTTYNNITNSGENSANTGLESPKSIRG